MHLCINVHAVHKLLYCALQLKMCLKIILTLALSFSSCLQVHSAQVFNVMQYGAIGDGIHSNTEAIAKAISAAHQAPSGGTVNFPNGTYFTGPIVFKSNVHLHLEEGSVLKFSDNFDDYLPMVPVRFEGIVVQSFSPLIYAYNQSNFGITGSGTLDGSGAKWWKFTRPLEDLYNANQPIVLNETKWQKEFVRQNRDLLAKLEGVLENRWLLSFHFPRPDFFQPMYSQYITLEGVTFKNSPFWTVAPTFSDHIRIHGLTIKNPRTQYNTDGIDPDSCRNVTITDCVIDVGDDCIAIKSGKDAQAREIGIPSENIIISNLHCNGLAAIAIGSEMSGSVRNVFVRNVTAVNVWNGLYFKTCRGRGGVVENIHFTDITILNKSKEYSISMYPFYTYGCMKDPGPKVSELTPRIRDIFVTNFTGSSKLGFTVVGLPETHFSNIQLRNVHLMAEQDEVITDVDDLLLSNFTYHKLSQSTFDNK